jgi:RimJ/RimL family protein N-acetyltransferase
MNINTFNGIVKLTNTELQLKDNKIVVDKKENDMYSLTSSFAGFRELFTHNPNLSESFRTITNQAFQRELPFETDSTYKRIFEFEPDDSSKDLMTMIYDTKNKEIVTCMSHNDEKTNYNYINSYIYAVFTNPKYYRKGYASGMIKEHIDTKIKDEKSIAFISTIYVWNIPSLNMFRKLGFIIYELKQTEDYEEHMKRKNMEYIPVFGYMNEKPITEDYYYIMILPSTYLMENNKSTNNTD